MHSLSVLDHWMNPYHQGLEGVPSPGEDSNNRIVFGQEGFIGEGPYLRLVLLLEDDTVGEAWFETYPCPSAIACGSALARWLEGRSLEEAAPLTETEVSLLMRGLALGKKHCAYIAQRAPKRPSPNHRIEGDLKKASYNQNTGRKVIKESKMAVGPHPNLYGSLTVGAPCASCSGGGSMSNSEKYQEYGGQFGPAGIPQPPCEDGNCAQGTFYTPSTGGPGR